MHVCGLFWQSLLTDMITTTHSDRLGKYVNDSPPKYANCVPNVLLIHGRPHVTIFAATTIMPGTELRYNYGGCVPWRMVGLE